MTDLIVIREETSFETEKIFQEQSKHRKLLTEHWEYSVNIPDFILE